MNPVLYLLYLILNIYWWIVVAAVVMSWLVGFNVVNTRNELVYRIVRALEALTEPVFRQVRKVIPPFGGLDLSPVVVLIAIAVLQYTLFWLRF